MYANGEEIFLKSAVADLYGPCYRREPLISGNNKGRGLKDKGEEGHDWTDKGESGGKESGKDSK